MKFFKNKYADFSRRLDFRTVVLFFVDAILISVAFFLALLIKEDLQISFALINSFFKELPIIILIYWIIFELFQMYKSLWDFAGFEEIIKGIIANVVATITAYLLVRFIYMNHLSFGFYLTALFTAIFFTLSSRMFYRIYKSFEKLFRYEEADKKALIVGAGNAGNLVFNEVNNNHTFPGTVIGFIDDDSRKLDRSIHGIPVLGTCDEVDLIINEKDIDIVYVAIPGAPQDRIRTVLNLIESTGTQIKLFPPFYELLRDREDSSFKLRDVKIEDLLSRDVIKLEEDGIRDYIDGKSVVVTGGGGSIGSELVRQLRHFNPATIIIIDIYENNAYDLQQEMSRLYNANNVKHKPNIVVLIASVRDRVKMNEIFEEYRPDVVFHAAAHKHVPLMETSPTEAIKNNVMGTYNVALASDKYGVDKFVLVSTDKAVRPTNVMGASKRMAEKVIMSLNEKSNTDYAAVRFGNVLGSNGSVIPLFKRQIEEGGPVTVTDPEIIRYFMTIPEASQLVIQAGAFACGGELFVLDMGNPVKIIDLAFKMIRLSGFEPNKDIEVKFTGLRPGEKMYEELLIDSNTITKTSNKKIFIEKKSNSDKGILEKISYLSNTINKDDVLPLIKEFVSDFNPKKHI